MALDPEDREHCFEGIFEVSAERRRLPLWYKKEAF
jgi:hypothetical protein